MRWCRPLAPGGVLVWVVDDTTEDGAKSLASFKQCLGFVERGLILHDTLIYQKRGGSGPLLAYSSSAGATNICSSYQWASHR